MKTIFKDDLIKEAMERAEGDIAFNKGRWTEREELCYRTAFANGLTVAMQILDVPEKQYNTRTGKRIN